MKSFLTKFKVSTLNQISLLCGFANGTNKQQRIDSIISGLALFNHINRHNDISNLNFLSIDIGFKNFAYCNTLANLIDDSPINISHWNKLNLDETFGNDFTSLNYSPLQDEKNYTNFISNQISSQLLALDPQITIIETQRTKSNNNQITLPSILKNYTLENLIYNKFYLQQKLIIPMTSAQMINFWLNRFICKKSIKMAKNAKQFRNQLVLDWLSKSRLVKFDKLGISNANSSSIISSASSNMDTNPTNSSATSTITKSALLSSLNLPTKNNKIDDLVDSLLYNLTIIQQLKNQRMFNHYLLNQLDMEEFVRKYNQVQLDLIEDLVTANNLELLSEFNKD